MKDLPGKITISRVNDGEEGYIEINIEDDGSHKRFLTVKLNYENFTKALMNQAYIPVIFDAEALHVVGKIKESKALVFPVSDGSGQKEYAEKNCQLFADVGWKADGYYRSQSSIRKHDDGLYYAHGGQHRYVDKE